MLKGTQYANRGFSLIELMIVIVVGAAMVASAFAWLSLEARATTRDAMVADGAREVAMITRAVDALIKNPPATYPTDGTVTELSVGDLITLNYLPADFATKPVLGIGYSPIGQRYRIAVARKSSTWMGLVYQVQAPYAPFAAKAGIGTNDEAAAEFNRAVMSKLRADTYWPTGLVKNGNRAVDTSVSGFTKDLADWWPTNLTASTVVSLLGFPDLTPTAPIVVSGSGGGSGTPTPSGPQLGQQCYLTTGACASGYTEGYTYRLCDNWGYDLDSNPTQVFVNTQVGQITINRKVLGICGGTPQPGNRFSIPGGQTCGATIGWPSTYMPSSQWSTNGSSGSYMITNYYCNGTNYSNLRFDGYNLVCPANGATDTDFHNPTCGWMYGKGGGADCMAPYYVPYNNTAYSSGLTATSRTWMAVALGSVKAPSNTTTFSFRSQDTVVSTLPICSGSMNTVPITIRSKSFNGGTIQYMDLTQGTWHEEIVYNGTVQASATCETDGYTTSSLTVTGQAVVNNCPSISDPAYGSSRKGIEAYRIRLPEASRPTARVCCK